MPIAKTLAMAEAKERGNALYKSGKFADAVKAYDESIALDPNVASVYANKAAALSGQGRRFNRQAMEACVSAVAIDPTYARAKTRLSALISKLGDLDAAAAAAEALSASPAEGKETPGASVLRDQLRVLRDGRREGNERFKAGDTKKARDVYTEALREASALASREPSDDAKTLASVPGSHLLLCNRAACSSALGDYANALADVEAVLALDPEYVKAKLRKAHALRDAGDLGRAEETFLEIRQCLPGDVAVATSLNELRKSMTNSPASNTTETAGPIHVRSAAQYGTLLKTSKLVLVDFTASWCGPCRQIAPVFSQLSLQYPEVHFVKVDVDEVQEVAQAEHVRSMPTFKVYRYGTKTEEFSGADPGKLKQLVEKYLPTVA